MRVAVREPRSRVAVPEPRPRGAGPVVAIAVATLLVGVCVVLTEEVLLLFAAVLLSLYLRGTSDQLRRRLGLPPRLGLAAAVILTLALLAAIGRIIVPPVLEQASGLITTVPGILTGLEARFIRLVASHPLLGQALPPGVSGGVFGSMFEWLRGHVEAVLLYLLQGFGFLVHAVSVVAMALYLSLEPARYVEGVVALVPPGQRTGARALLHDVGATLRAWIGGQLLATLAIGVLAAVGFTALRVPYPLAFGAFTGLATVVPFFGALLSTLLPALVVLGGGSPLHAAAVLLLGITVHLVESSLIHPLIMARRVHLPPVLSILAVLTLGKLLGAIGVVIAVPAVAVLLVLVRSLWMNRVDWTDPDPEAVQ